MYACRRAFLRRCVRAMVGVAVGFHSPLSSMPETQDPSLELHCGVETWESAGLSMIAAEEGKQRDQSGWTRRGDPIQRSVSNPLCHCFSFFWTRNFKKLIVSPHPFPYLSPLFVWVSCSKEFVGVTGPLVSSISLVCLTEKPRLFWHLFSVG